MSMIKNITICALGFILFYPHIIFACPQKLTPSIFVKAFTADQKSQNAFIKQLKTCLPTNTTLQRQTDDFVVDSLAIVNRFPKKDQQLVVDFNLKVLKVNAEAGFASSQHNYAAVYNARPGSLLQKLIPQNYCTFIYWTRKAAAQKEPRALFNLAVRLAAKKPVPYVKHDPQTAYIIFNYLQQYYATNPQLPKQMSKYITKIKAELLQQLGKKEAKKLDAQSMHFNFASLAPENMNSPLNCKGSIRPKSHAY